MDVYAGKSAVVRFESICPAGHSAGETYLSSGIDTATSMAGVFETPARSFSKPPATRTSTQPPPPYASSNSAFSARAQAAMKMTA